VQAEVILRWLPKIETAENRHKRSAELAKQHKGELGSVYEAAKADGVDIDALKNARKLDKRDHAEVALHYANTGRYLRIMESKLATQLELFGDVKQPPPVNPFLAGQQVGREGGSIDECSYKPGTEDFDLWHDGYASGQSKIHDTLRAGEPAPAN
jgi:uncharacterized protein (UPF0335 family)